MTTVHAQFTGKAALLQHDEFDHLVKLAEQVEAIDVQAHEDDLPTLAMMRLTEQGGAFDFWHEDGEDIYTLKDGEPV